MTSPLVFAGLVALVAVGCALAALLTSRGHRRASARRAFERRPRTMIGALREGELVRIQGVVAAREPLLTSPIDGRSCIGYEAIIDDQTHHPDYEWDPLVRRKDWPPFLVTDDTGTAAVEGPFSMNLDAAEAGESPPPSAYALLAKDDVRMKDLWGPRRFWFRETVLNVGDRVSVIGRPSLVLDSAVRGSSREPPPRYVMRGSDSEPILVINEDQPAG